MWTMFVLNYVGVGLAILYLLRRYCYKNVPVIVRLAVSYAWLVSMSIVVLVPLDIYTTLQGQEFPIISIIWKISYWSTFALTYCLMPFFQQYAQAGEFTVLGKIGYSLRENGLLVAVGGTAVVLGVVAGVIAGKLTLATLPALVMACSNSMILVLGLLLLGYGLVEVPRMYWKANPERQLKWCAHRSGKFAEQVMKSTAELDTVVTIVYANQRQIRRHDTLKPYMDIIAAEAEADSPVKPSQMAARNVDLEQLSAEDLEYNFDKAGLAKLRYRMFHAIHEYHAARYQYDEVMEEAFELEDIVKCRQLHDWTPRVEGIPSQWTKAVWFYKCAVRTHWYKFVSIMFWATTLSIIWGEAVIPVHPNLSPFSLFLQYGGHGEASIWFLVMFPLVYICACTYFALFQVSAFHYNQLIPRATAGHSLMQNGSLMGRFSAPVCWNFYHIVRMTKDIGGSTPLGADQVTVFQERMQHMAVLPWLGANINIYLPVALAVHCLLVVFGVWNSLLTMCVASKYKFSTDDTDDEYTEKGRLLIRKEQEAKSKGYAIGDVLHSAFIDLEFPSIMPKGKKKGIFGGMFSKKASSGALLGGTNAASSSAFKASSSYSAATAAAGRWSTKGPAASAASATSSMTSDMERPAPLTSSKWATPTASDAAPAPSGGKNNSSLDGLFAELSSNKAGGGGGGNGGGLPSRFGGSASVRKPDGGSGGGGGGGGDEHVKETTSLLGRWGRS